MSYGNRFGSLGHPLSCADFMDCMKNVGAVVSVSTPIADSDYHIFQDDESVLVFERLPLNSPRLYGAFAITRTDRKSTRLNSSHANISYAVFCLKKKTKNQSDKPLHTKAAQVSDTLL